MSGTRWLSDDEQRTWRAYLASTQLLQDALERQLQRDSGMPHAYYMILAMLSEAPGRTLTMTRLARVTRFSASRLSHAMARLEEKGWVRRVKHGQDRRTTMAELTGEGFAVLEAAAPGHVEEVRHRLFDPLTGEQARQFRDILATLTAAYARDGHESDLTPP
ncbi:MarR family transcriptional regulator [Microtetraspora sp. NBRC 16547]|uniref:MarR family winged helix-turn-helix transcriptional regulator n=1 Tax=Microtetraspora sp. NBRC 16547 TaxID=3030993 RepID=UPI0024A3AC43|nr:MarR family transcriptional regulator [Microtetraspora sp. NBRC 16547]GLW98628.1 MarR family transcriptional regulator [Microtetraspora sp. NBRC 16547]